MLTLFLLLARRLAWAALKASIELFDRSEPWLFCRATACGHALGLAGSNPCIPNPRNPQHWHGLLAATSGSLGGSQAPLASI